MSSRIMVIAGGAWQVPLVRAAKALGHYVVCSNLYPDSPAFEWSDAAETADVLDRERQLELARKHQVDAVITDQSDIAVPTVAWVCEQLGLPGIGSKAARLFTNKHQMREFARGFGHPTPDFALCLSLQDALSFSQRATFPLVLKPVASQASRGVFKVETMSELRTQYPLSAALSGSGEVIVEEFIQGTELTIEGFSSNGTHQTLAISRKRHLPNNPMVACELYYSPTEEGIDYAALRVQHDAMVTAMGLPFGITHAEYLHRDGEFYLVEVAARGGGTKISSHIVPTLSGAPTYEWLITHALGHSVSGAFTSRSETPFAILSFFNFAPGVARLIHGVEAVRAMAGIVDIGMNVRDGSNLMPPADDVARHGYFIAKATTRAELNDLVATVRATVTVTYA